MFGTRGVGRYPLAQAPEGQECFVEALFVIRQLSEDPFEGRHGLVAVVVQLNDQLEVAESQTVQLLSLRLGQVGSAAPGGGAIQGGECPLPGDFGFECRIRRVQLFERGERLDSLVIRGESFCSEQGPGIGSTLLGDLVDHLERRLLQAGSQQIPGPLHELVVGEDLLPVEVAVRIPEDFNDFELGGVDGKGDEKSPRRARTRLGLSESLADLPGCDLDLSQCAGRESLLTKKLDALEYGCPVLLRSRQFDPSNGGVSSDGRGWIPAQ